MKNLFILVYFLLTQPSANAILSPWRSHSNPNIMSKNFERTFEKLPLSGSIVHTQKLWSNDYWPNNRGIINYRWNSSTPTGFELISPTKDEAIFMSLDEISALAPSEKLDLLNGDYKYPLKYEVNQKSYPKAPSWHGICDGWASATINHNEPVPKILNNPDGIRIPFGSSDIKGILSYYYAFKHKVNSTHQMGKRCNWNFRRNCIDDLNAGAYHIVLANKVGLEQSSFIVDVDNGKEVWNHAVNEFNTTVINANLKPSNTSARGAVKRVHVKTAMTFVLAIKDNNWAPVLGTDDQINGVVNYEYLIELDSLGKIIGGEWLSHDRPDFLWTKERATRFGGMFARLPELLND